MKKAGFKLMFFIVLAAFGIIMEVSAGTYANIRIDGTYCDWTSVPVLYTDASGDGAPIDLATIQIANDESNLYIRLTYHTAVDPQTNAGTYVAIDNDSNPATGFDIFGLGLVGSEAGWQNDFPFAQSNGVFNTGGGITANAVISPYATSTTEQEYRIPRSAAFTTNGLPVFPGNSFTLLVYTVDAPTDVAGAVPYTFASKPPGTYASINIDGNFCDWSGVPVLYADCTGDGSPIDLATVQIANDESNLYVRLTYYSAVNPNSGPSVFLALDNDNNPATGFDVYGLGLIGAEAGWQNDFPFAQSNGVYNTGGGITGGVAVISPYYTSTTEQEYAISRSATFTTNGLPVFPGNSLTLLVWTDAAGNEVAGPVSYTFAAQPPPLPAGTYANIAIDGDFSDWTNVPVRFTDCSGDGSPIDLGTVQLANDASNLYVRLTYYTEVNPQTNSGVYLAFDTDSNPATGFDILTLGLVGAEAGWQNDFPFAQSNGVFNAGVITNGGALISPYNTSTTAQEYAIPRSATYDANGQLVFSGNSFTLLVYAPDGSQDVAGVVPYTFVAPADFRIFSIKRVTNDIAIAWMAPGGTTNFVQATNGSNGSYTTNGFANISGLVINPGSASTAVTNNYVDPFGATNKPARYYRVSEVP